MPKDYEFYHTCVNWPSDDVHSDGGLIDMIDEAKDIIRDTFVRHISQFSLHDVERALGYAPSDPHSILTMAKDFHVSYHKSKLHGETVYFFKHSAIEYVFKKVR